MLSILSCVCWQRPPPRVGWRERKVKLQRCTTPKALLLSDLLVFAVHSLKNSGGIHTALTPSRIPADFRAQKCSWAQGVGGERAASFPEIQAKPALSSEERWPL